MVCLTISAVKDTCQRKGLGVAVGLLVLQLTGCVVSERCFKAADCDPGEVCNSQGRCVGPPGDQGVPVVDGDALVSIRCTLPGMTKVAETFCIDIYEASRPDASEISAGVDERYAASRAGVLPWRVESNAAAERACNAAGKRLCTPAEWQLACQGPEPTAYAYGDSYEPETCNGIDTFGRSAFHLMPTGSFPACTNEWGVYDMNGNLWEHTADGDNTTIRGGAYNCGDSETLHRCSYIPGNWSPSARGFRCCASGTPLTADGGPTPPDSARRDGASEQGCLTDPEAGLDLAVDQQPLPDRGAVDGADAAVDAVSDAVREGSLPDLPGEGGSGDRGPVDAASDFLADSSTSSRCPLPGMIEVAGRFCADIYEASRPDATAGWVGIDESRATSRQGVLPWMVSSNAAAEQACNAAGKRLCSEAEWFTLCRGPSQTVYCYGDVYEPTTCNGLDTFPGQWHLLPTGSLPGCTNAYGIFDINGNVWEHVALGDDTRVRGGAFNCGNSEALHRCDYIPTTWAPSARGFRCCAALSAAEGGLDG